MRKLFMFSIVVLLAGCGESGISGGDLSSVLNGLIRFNQLVLDAAGKIVGEEVSQEGEKVQVEALVNGVRQVGHRDFSTAKKILPRLYAGMEVDFYCGCHYRGKTVDWASCGYQPRRSAARARRIEWEHVVPAWVLGHQRQCWQRGGRQNCSRVDPLFQMAEGDLNNLVPAVGEVNGDRSNFAYSSWSSNPRLVYGQCRSVVDFSLHKFQPREEVRGSAARITLYMHAKYGLQMSRQDRRLMCAWARQYPVDAWEVQRNQRIEKWQGTGNFLVTAPERLVEVCPEQ